MKNLIKRIGTALVAVLVAVAAVPLGGVIGVYAASEAPNLVPDAVPSGNNDGVMLSKQAVPVDGYNNMWDITLKIESPKVSKTSDTILVIDQSGSMAGTKMTSAKDAALSLAAQLLPEGNETNQVAVISFADDADTKIGFSKIYGCKPEISGVCDAIDEINVISGYDRGGTFTQGGMRAAVNLMATSTAQIKNIILLSDGEPTYGYGFTDEAIIDDNNFQNNISKSTVSSDAFTGSRVGNGRGETTEVDACARYETIWVPFVGDIQRCVERKYRVLNHGNSAIAEAKNRPQNAGGLYTIAFDVANNQRAKDVLTGMADDGKMYLANESNLADVFNQIAGIITNLINSATVEDLMGDGIVISEQAANGICLEQGVTCTDGGKITWTPTFVYDAASDKYVATLTYRVEADENNDWENGNSFKLNEEAKITYNGDKIGYFPTPTIPKPAAIKVTKQLNDATGLTSADATFEINLNAKDEDTVLDGVTFDKTISVKAGETKNVVKAFPVGRYTVSETGTTGNSVAIENYLKEYEINNADSNGSFSIAQGQANGVNITVTNTYETVDVVATKEWKDDGDRDGLRSGLGAYVALLNNGNVATYVKINTDKDDTYSFNKLSKFYNNNLINYSIVEATGCETPTGCTVFNGNSDYDVEVTFDDATNKYAIANTHNYEKVNVKVIKGWDDERDRDGFRFNNPTRLVEFCITGTVDDGATVAFDRKCETKAVKDIDAGEAIEFKELPKNYPKGKEIKWMIEEGQAPFPGYTPNYVSSQYITITSANEGKATVMNMYTPERRNVDVEVVWDDDGNAGGKRPASVDVNLAATNDTVSKTIMVAGSSATWNDSFADLYKYKAGTQAQTEIEYVVSQVTMVDGYDTFVSGDMDNGFTITNVRQRSVEVQIEWDDVNNKDGSRPAHVEVELMMDGIVASPSLGVDVSGAMSPIVGATESCGSWCIRFINLPAKKQNSTGALEEVVWGVKSTTLVAGYTRVISGDMKNGYVIKYSHKPTVSSPNTGFNTVDTKNNGRAVENNMLVIAVMPIMAAALGLFAIVAKRKEAAEIDKKA